MQHVRMHGGGWLQSDSEQRRHKLSYHLDGAAQPRALEVMEQLRGRIQQQGLRAKVRRASALMRIHTHTRLFAAFGHPRHPAGCAATLRTRSALCCALAASSGRGFTHQLF